MKKCTCCGADRPESMFNKNKSEKDGLQRHCNMCRKAYREKHKDALNAVSRSYYEANKEELKKKFKTRYQETKDELRESENERKRKYAQATPEKQRARLNAWRAKNPGSAKAQWARRRQSKRVHSGFDNELDQLVFAEAGELARLREQMLGGKWHIDHIIPLGAKDACGLHNGFNIAVVPASFNLRKSNKLMPDFAWIDAIKERGKKELFTAEARLKLAAGSGI